MISLLALPSLLLSFCAANKKLIIGAFFGVYAMLFLYCIAVVYIFTIAFPFIPVIAELARSIGEGTIFVFVLVTLPGILGRFRIQHPFITLGIMFRRYMGILSFLMGFSHAWTMFIFPTLQDGVFPFTTSPDYVLFGEAALLLLFPLFVTSNDLSVRILKRWWKRLHRLVYVIYWLIFLHVMQQGTNWRYVIGTAAVLEVISLIYDAILKRRAQSIQPQ